MCCRIDEGGNASPGRTGQNVVAIMVEGIEG
jgi:hypothetical protein